MKMGRSAPLPGFHSASHGARALSSIQLSGTQQRLFWIGILIRFWFSQERQRVGKQGADE